jgi:hypothetical protein
MTWLRISDEPSGHDSDNKGDQNISHSHWRSLLSMRNTTVAPNPAGAVLLDDFHSSGRISGNQSTPLAKLVSGKKYFVEGQRLEVNPSVDRYKREMANLSAAL